MEKILIVDDSPVQASQLQAILADSYDVTIAQTAQEGLSRASSGAYALVLLDVVMPGMDGFSLLEKLQQESFTRHLPVILITSLSDIAHEQQGLTLGAVDYITKPFHPAIVKARVNTHVKLFQLGRQMERQSMTDQLTGVANRRRHDCCAGVKWQEAVRLQTPFSICLFDIDKFKAYNDTFGHPAGDQVLTTVARTVSSFLRRSTDFFARYGGEEFVAFLAGGAAGEVFAYLKQVRQAVENLRIPHAPGISPWVTVSIGGVTVTPQRGQDYSTYLKVADTMLYDAKRAGRNRVVWSNGRTDTWQEKPSCGAGETEGGSYEAV